STRAGTTTTWNASSEPIASTEYVIDCAATGVVETRYERPGFGASAGSDFEQEGVKDTAETQRTQRNAEDDQSMEFGLRRSPRSAFSAALCDLCASAVSFTSLQLPRSSSFIVRSPSAPARSTARFD